MTTETAQQGIAATDYAGDKPLATHGAALRPGEKTPPD